MTNSIFESHPEWWDILCDINNGKILVSSSVKDKATEMKVKKEDYQESYDCEFMLDVSYISFDFIF